MANRYSATGPQTSAAPTAGSSDRKAITTAHSSGAWIPSIQNASPPMAPWAAATRKLPFTVARITVVNFSNNSRLFSPLSGTARWMRLASALPSLSRKNSRYTMTKKLTTKSKAFMPTLSILVAMKRLPSSAASDSLACSVPMLSMPNRPMMSCIHAGKAAKIFCRKAAISISPETTF